jgi:hypothetical protein
VRPHRIETRLSLFSIVIAAVATIQCGGGSGSPVSPSGPTVAGVSLSATNAARGATVQGGVTLSAAAPAEGATVSLSSSNSAVATVAPSVAVMAGATSATFMVTAAGVGTATITASLNGKSQSSPQITIAAGVSISSISLSASSVAGGDPVTGTATLTGSAPAGGAVVSLSGGDAVSVPANVTVPAGATSATFLISTRAVGGTISATITGSYGGASASVTLSVTPPVVATAGFGVTGPTESDTCTMTNGGNTLNCTFDGSTSSAPGSIVEWDWSFGVATMISRTTSGPVLEMPSVTCAMLPPPPLPAGTTSFKMIVTLQVRDNRGNVSKVATHPDVRLLPQGVCGF